MIRKLLLFISLNFILSSLYSQNNTPSIPFELFFGSNRTNTQLSLNKNIKGKFYFANLTVAAADYKNTLTENEVI
ncbi:MAG: hypothetical protein PHI14_02910, partial [Bacteroidales bacterium]|nr:hypothetical protein [Bacteroidales bacterium]